MSALPSRAATRELVELLHAEAEPKGLLARAPRDVFGAPRAREPLLYDAPGAFFEPLDDIDLLLERPKSAVDLAYPHRMARDLVFELREPLVVLPLGDERDQPAEQPAAAHREEDEAD